MKAMRIYGKYTDAPNITKTTLQGSLLEMWVLAALRRRPSIIQPLLYKLCSATVKKPGWAGDSRFATVLAPLNKIIFIP